MLELSSIVNRLTTFDLRDSGDDDEEVEASVWEKDQEGQRLTGDFLRKFLTVAKHLRPTLTPEAAIVLEDEYAKMRDVQSLAGFAASQPVTPRALETLIRLATASGKARLSRKITIEDAEEAVQLANYAMFKKLPEKAKSKPTAAEVRTVQESSGQVERVRDEARQQLFKAALLRYI